MDEQELKKLQAIKQHYGFALPAEYRAMREAGWCASVPWLDERLDFFLGETMWFKLQEILDFRLNYPDLLPGLVPFATETHGEIWCWHTRHSGPFGTPVLECEHDSPEAEFYAPNLTGWLYRRLLDYAWYMAWESEDTHAEMREHLKFWQDRLSPWFPPEWNRTLELIRQSSQPLSDDERDAIVSRDLTFPLLGQKIDWVSLPGEEQTSPKKRWWQFWK